MHILLLEDNPADAELIEDELRQSLSDFVLKWVVTEEDFTKELLEYCPDIILSDYDLPRYNGALALADAGRLCPDVPFILVTGAVTEDRAIEILTNGAKDYVLKTRLQQRLVPAVQRALSEAEEHQARKKAEDELRETYRILEKQVEERTSELQENKERLNLALISSGMGTFEWDIVNGASSMIMSIACLGSNRKTSPERLKSSFRVIHPDDRHAVQSALNKAIEQDIPYETRIHCHMAGRYRSSYRRTRKGSTEHNWPTVAHVSEFAGKSLNASRQRGSYRRAKPDSGLSSIILMTALFLRMRRASFPFGAHPIS